MKIFILIFALCLFATSINAEPNWFARHKRVLAVVGINAAGLAINAAGLRHCRQGDVENCTAHYGAAWGTFGVQAGVTTTFVILGEVAHKSGDSKLGNILSFTPAAFNTAWGINEWHQYGPEKDSTSLKINPLWLRRK